MNAMSYNSVYLIRAYVLTQIAFYDFKQTLLNPLRQLQRAAEGISWCFRASVNGERFPFPVQPDPFVIVEFERAGLAELP